MSHPFKDSDSVSMMLAQDLFFSFFLSLFLSDFDATEPRKSILSVVTVEILPFLASPWISLSQLTQKRGLFFLIKYSCGSLYCDSPFDHLSWVCLSGLVLGLWMSWHLIHMEMAFVWGPSRERSENLCFVWLLYVACS